MKEIFLSENYSLKTLSKNTFRKAFERLIEDASDNPFELVLPERAERYARTYASLRMKIAIRESGPIEGDGGATGKLPEQTRWELASLAAQCGNWGVMKAEILDDAKELLQNPSCYEDVRRGYTLQDIAKGLKP